MIILVVFGALCAGGQAALKAEELANLRLVHVLFRHGDRSPIERFPNDPYVNFTYPPHGFGQLTTTGYRNQYQAGQFLRQRYDQFLGKDYHPDVVAVLTTGVDRVVMSAQLQMAGLWPPSPRQQWNTHLNWQPFSMAVNEVGRDALLEVDIPCPPYDEEVQRYSNSPEFRRINDDYRELMQYVEERSGKKMPTVQQLGFFYTELIAQKLYGLELPKWTEAPSLMDQMKNVAEEAFILHVKTPQMRRIKGGPLLNKILQDSNAAASNSQQVKHRKLYMYAAHDKTVTSLLATLNVWEPQVPVFGMAVLLEVHEDPKTNEYGLKVFLRNSTTVEPHPLRIPNCGFWCPLQQLEKIYADFLPEDIERECKSSDRHQK